MSWCSERRLDYVEDYLVDHGKIKSNDIAAYFGVTQKVGRWDLRLYVEANPYVRYAHYHRAYVALAGFTPVRGSTQRRRRAWGLWKPGRSEEVSSTETLA